MNFTIDLTSHKYGRLTVIGPAGKTESHVLLWKCKCECGNIVVCRNGNLTYGTTQSCGCLRKERMSKRQTTHGMSFTPERMCWKSIKSRCYNPNNHEYKNYGGRGIKVCDKWLESFVNFFEDMGCRPSPNHSIDRIDVNKNYEPLNCKWSTIKEQNRNKRSTVWIEYNGQRMCMADWADKLGIKYKTLNNRFAKGWSVERALQNLS